MRYIVTGAGSFIGSRTVKSLISAGHEVTALRHSFEESQGVLPDNADIWIHFAWAGVGSSGRSDTSIQQYNIRMTLAAYERAGSMGCSRFLMAGSQAEYGHAQDGALKKEYGGVKPVSEYGRAKLEVLRQLSMRPCLEKPHGDCIHGDALLHAAGPGEAVSGLDACISDPGLPEPGFVSLEGDALEAVNAPAAMAGSRRPVYIHMRLFSVYGEGDHETSLISSVLRSARDGSLLRMGACRQLWDYLYIDDAVRAVILLGSSHEARGIYNIGSGDIRSLREYAAEAAELVRPGASSLLGFGQRGDNAEGSADLSPDISRISALGFRPQVTFAEGIKRMLGTGDLQGNTRR